MFSSLYTLYYYFPIIFFIRLTIDLMIVAFGVFIAVKLYHKGVFTKGQSAACIVLFVWGAIVLLFTVLGRRSYKTDDMIYNLELFSCYHRIFAEHDQPMLKSVMQNIFMFIPIGFSLAAISKKHRIIIPLLISFGFSLCIEVCQLLLRAGLFEMDDLFNNTLGAFIGIIMFLVCRSVYIFIRKEDDLAAKNDC